MTNRLVRGWRATSRSQRNTTTICGVLYFAVVAIKASSGPSNGWLLILLVMPLWVVFVPYTIWKRGAQGYDS